MPVEGERYGDPTLAHEDERYAISQGVELVRSLAQEVERPPEELLVHMREVDRGTREQPSTDFHSLGMKSAGVQVRDRFVEDVRRAHQARHPLFPERPPMVQRSRMILVVTPLKRKQVAGVDEDLAGAAGELTGPFSHLYRGTGRGSRSCRRPRRPPDPRPCTELDLPRRVASLPLGSSTISTSSELSKTRSVTSLGISSPFFVTFTFIDAPRLSSWPLSWVDCHTTQSSEVVLEYRFQDGKNALKATLGGRSARTMPLCLIRTYMDRRLTIHFPQGHEVVTVAEAGWAGKKNGELLGLAEKEFDVFITTDNGIPYQQNVSRLDLAVVLLRAKSNAYEVLAPLMDEVDASLETIESGTVHTVFASEPS